MSYKIPDRKKPGFKRLIKRLLVALLLLAVLAVIALVSYYQSNLKAVGGDSSEVVFVVDEGTTFPAISGLLQEKQLIRSASVFDWYIRLNSGGELKAGTYKLNKSMAVADIVRVLTEGKVATDLVTILPGKRVDQIKSELMRAGFDPAAVDAALEPSIYGSHPVFAGMNLPNTLEGFIYPESFVIAAGISPEEVIRLALDETNKALTAEVRAGINAQGLTVYEGLILASIVGNEVSDNVPEDKPMVAQVFLKRLRLGMMLQSNATDAISEKIGPQYDTYSIVGLPPTPISNISASSIRAVANPSKTDYLYFVSGSDCVTRFSSSDAQHESLKSQYGVATADDQCR